MISRSCCSRSWIAATRNDEGPVSAAVAASRRSSPSSFCLRSRICAIWFESLVNAFLRWFPNSSRAYSIASA